MLVTSLAIVTLATCSFGASDVARAFAWQSGGSSTQSAMVTNPAYGSWAKCAIGTVLHTRMSVTTGGKATVLEIESKLVSIDAEREILFLETVLKSDQGEQRQRRPIPAKLEEGRLYNESGVPGLTMKRGGTETITVDGVEYPCALVRITGTVNGNDVEIQVWENAAIPGAVAKMAMKSPVAEMTMDAVKFAPPSR